MQAKRPTVGTQSPWGPVQDVQQVAEGVVMVSTAGHGGVWVDPSVSKAWPREAMLGNPDRCWWEEDCEAAVPIFLVTESDALREICLQSIERWYPEIVEVLR